jgi:hypothetical protein
VKRSQRQLAKIRQAQTANPPLTPYSVTSDAPTPAAPTLTAAEIAAKREDAIEIAVRSNAQIFSLKSQLSWEEMSHRNERREAQEQFARLQSRIEKLEQDALTAYTKLREHFAVMASEHKSYLYDLVREGKFCAHAAAPPAEIQKEVEIKIEEITCQQS